MNTNLIHYDYYNDYEIYLEEGYCIIRKTGRRIYATQDVLKTIERDQWRIQKEIGRNRKRYLSYNVETEERSEMLDFFPTLPNKDPSNQVEENELRNLLFDVIERFPRKTKEIGVLYYINHLNEIEIAKMLNESHQSIHYHKKKFVQLLSSNEQIKDWDK